MVSIVLNAIPRSVSHPLRILAGWTNWLVALWLRRAAIKALQQLDDRQLQDIGVSRGEIKAAVNGVRTGRRGAREGSMISSHQPESSIANE
jgi:uncharacterized protein YjiS (DUF1127 family)